MPAKMQMIISNRRFGTVKTFTQTNSKNLAKTSIHNSKSVYLSSSMISRINKIQPGCGSCGR